MLIFSPSPHMQVSNSSCVRWWWWWWRVPCVDIHYFLFIQSLNVGSVMISDDGVQWWRLCCVSLMTVRSDSSAFLMRWWLSCLLLPCPFSHLLPASLLPPPSSSLPPLSPSSIWLCLAMYVGTHSWQWQWKKISGNKHIYVNPLTPTPKNNLALQHSSLAFFYVMYIMAYDNKQQQPKQWWMVGAWWLPAFLSFPRVVPVVEGPTVFKCVAWYYLRRLEQCMCGVVDGGLPRTWVGWFGWWCPLVGGCSQLGRWAEHGMAWHVCYC